MKRLFRFVEAVVNMAIVSSKDTAREIRDRPKEALSGERGAADATFAVIGVVVALLIVFVVVVLVFHYMSGASAKIDHGLNSVP